ncbi:MAG: diaminopimelate decarboxylase [Alphaproteobacteria bacterium]|nr:diaminopimelate decarboxylase [Alphaproteobacteria bacterium]TAD87524.1 MAG: diaminopimelate decarboxylase [Alphaproteobacteria bacterium]
MAFGYRAGRYCAEGVDLTAIAEAVGTPTYVYSRARLEERFTRFAAALSGLDAMVCFALKANSNLAVVKTLATAGAGGDVVSAGEIARARAAGIPADRIVFAGVGKTSDEMTAALDAGIYQFNCESEPEISALSALAAGRGQVAPVCVRVNPDVDAGTLSKITTGKKGNKFGIDIDLIPALFDRVRALPGVRLVGVSLHLGSLLNDLAPYRAAFQRMADLVRQLRAAGHAVERLDLGGGLGVPYRDEVLPTPEAYGALVRETVADLGCRLIFEPGRYLVADAGVMLARVVYVKEGSDRRFLILDAAMNDLMRPALYGAWHTVRPVLEPLQDAAEQPVDIVGPVCESTDTFAQGRLMPPVAAGELVVFETAGAYGRVMASSYNTRPEPAEVLVDGDRFAVVKPRPLIQDLFQNESIPSWLEGSDG